MSEYEPEQLAAGFRSMSMLAGLVERGGRPAAVSPTVVLRPGEQQYGWFPVYVAGAGRRLAVITSQRLIVGSQEYLLRSVASLRPRPEEWTLVLEVHGSREAVTMRGPWVPWLGVVICSELYGTAWPPSMSVIPGPRRRTEELVIQ
ncbi:hypothetical protein [Actinoplanes sp. GCM10030250]|uniref:hypothetical protein n=1 Tax=Actinoplanes sp. GCM10030250 TaxID=3273376 RepID=UPI00360D4F49